MFTIFAFATSVFKAKTDENGMIIIQRKIIFSSDINWDNIVGIIYFIENSCACDITSENCSQQNKNVGFIVS